MADNSLSRAIPMHTHPSNNSATSQPDAMNITPGSGNMGPPFQNNAGSALSVESFVNGAQGQAGGAAYAAQQPKVVQTAFIHKLYNMLEDQSIQHLITWSNSHDSFIISPTAEFSKVLATYFKHTNVSSFVRQLNMYGFHKVSDVFHTGSPEQPLWEFKHGNGSFRRGDFAGLKEIKRRASRHTLIHRDSFPTQPRPLPLAMGPPVEQPPETVEGRLGLLEHSLHETHSRLARAEDANAFLVSKLQTMTETMIKCCQYNHDISSVLRSIVTDGEVRRVVQSMQTDINRQVEAVRNLDNIPQMESRMRQPSFAKPQYENGPPMSPFQLSQDDSRRGSLLNTGRLPFFRHPMPQRATTESSRKIEHYPPRGSSPPLPSIIPPSREPSLSQINEQQQHPQGGESALSPPNLCRRHTSADIRPHGWLSAVNSSEHLPLPQGPQSPFASGQSSGNWPSSPHPTPNSNTGEQQLRDTLARYQLSGSVSEASRLPPTSAFGPASSIQPQPPSQPQYCRHPSPPPPNESSNGGGAHHTHMSQTNANTNTNQNLNAAAPHAASENTNVSWSYSGARQSFKDAFSSSVPPTRRGSMAHLLNPAETAERIDEDDVGPDDLRKRKRLG